VRVVAARELDEERLEALREREPDVVLDPEWEFEDGDE